MIKLVGIVVIVLGFSLRWNTLLVVLGAGLATSLAAGLSWSDTVALLGKYFVENRYLTLPVIMMLPVIGVLERHGLRAAAEALLRRNRAATAGRVILLYTLIRQSLISVGVNIGGHAAAVRPLVAPMAEGAARSRHPQVSGAALQRIRALAAAGENIGNFFGEDIFVAVGGVLLMKGFFEAEGIAVSVWSIALWGIPTAIIAFLALVWRSIVLDRSLARESRDAAGRRDAISNEPGAGHNHP